ncbi:putative Translin-associated factor TraX [Taphrina deformans PYCC 5710]|uniref:Translin-associated factor TraX n=1 Tax=Taphrina deformans (strain PYCC 5710 / ATCC 11124 / CBS 356.35 / IMI 108563 / JCM 9778 / NBRC 8474) TaxID=1097556 RepID=R4X7U7_TAPDE|nr:putative Translin-associated factor TraX [Taphrina deformans PYCC 5710]|eukprot:CCG81505.1 putative Translin-associated factor TraX [Taphrina deformans PYCC 5710]
MNRYTASLFAQISLFSSFQTQSYDTPVLEEGKMTTVDLSITFSKFKNDIDHHYDRRERLIKTSRDVTALSKKMIFSLLRVPVLQADSDEDIIPSTIAQEVQKYESQIAQLLQTAQQDLQEANTWRYQRNISPGIQEFVEAITLKFYIQNQRVPALAETQKLVQPVDLTPADYILGVADLTGELTRRAIAALAIPGAEALDYTKKIASCLSDLTIRFQLLDADRNAEGLRELSKKIAVMESSLKKVERGVFERCVRGSERPEGWVGGADVSRED